MVAVNDRIRERLQLDGDVRVKFAHTVDPRFDAANREYVVVANTADVDLDAEVVLPKGCLPEHGGSMEYFLRNKMIFWAHEYDGLAVGKMRNQPKLTNAGWLVRIHMARTDFANDLATMMEDKIFPGSSIGFMALSDRKPTQSEIEGRGEHGRVVTAWHWLELSLTFMPCNPGCQGADHELMERALSHAVDTRRIGIKSAWRMGLPQRRIFPTDGVVGWRQKRTGVVLTLEPEVITLD